MATMTDALPECADWLTDCRLYVSARSKESVRLMVMGGNLHWLRQQMKGLRILFMLAACKCMEFDQKQAIEGDRWILSLLKVKSFSLLRVCLFVRRLNKYLINPLGRKEGGQIVLHSGAENGFGAVSLSLSAWRIKLQFSGDGPELIKQFATRVH